MAQGSKRLVAGFDAERGEPGMMQAIPANKIDHKKHQERAENHYSDRYLQAELKIAGVRDFPHELRS